MSLQYLRVVLVGITKCIQTLFLTAEMKLEAKPISSSEILHLISSWWWGF